MGEKEQWTSPGDVSSSCCEMKVLYCPGRGSSPARVPGRHRQYTQGVNSSRDYLQRCAQGEVSKQEQMESPGTCHSVQHCHP